MLLVLQPHLEKQSFALERGLIFLLFSQKYGWREPWIKLFPSCFSNIGNEEGFFASPCSYANILEHIFEGMCFAPVNMNGVI